MNHVAGLLVLVTTDRLTGGPVNVSEPVEPATDQHRVDGRGWHPEPISDLDRPQTLLPPQVHDLADHRCRRPVRLVVRR
jgi:hypothetical protein